jgi:hypothetical protein
VLGRRWRAAAAWMKVLLQRKLEGMVLNVRAFIKADYAS